MDKKAETIKLLTNKSLWLAPLAGYTNSAFRLICKARGADVVVSEMVSADGIIHKQRQTLSYLDFNEEERPFGVQLFGHDAAVMAKAVEMTLHWKPDFIDINMGCPVKKVIKRGAGGALMEDMPRAAGIISNVRQVLPKEFPLSVKFRSGTDINHLNYIDFGKAMQDAGADLVTLHPRTVKQVFTGVSNWQHIEKLKKHLFIPVVGNGDIKTADDGIDMLQSTGCDAIMIGRGAVGNPWIFNKIRSLTKGEQAEPVSNKEILATLIEHIELELRSKPELRVVREIRSHLCQYIRGFAGCAVLRAEIIRTETANGLKKLLTEAYCS